MAENNTATFEGSNGAGGTPLTQATGTNNQSGQNNTQTGGAITGEKLNEEDETMTNGERIKFNELVNAVSNLAEKVDKLTNPMIYNYIDDNMPEWAREAVKWAVDSGIIKGDGSGLNLDDKDLRYITILYRLNG